MSESEGIGIGVGLTLSILTVAGLGIAAYTGRLSGIKDLLSPFMFALANFIPFGLITFGFIADMIGQEFRYSIASIIGIISIIFGKVADLFFNKVSSTGLSSVVDTGHMWCFIPGLEGLESKSLPMNFMVMGSVMTYYLIFGILNRNINVNASLLSAFFIFPIVQGLAFYLGGCSQWYSGGVLGNILSWIIGISLGGISYAIVNAVNPSRSPFGYNWSSQPSSGYRSSAPNPGVGGPPPTGAKCSAADTDDNNAFVCEAYKNGVLVTEKIS
jgi:hypothetical protein